MIRMLALIALLSPAAALAQEGEHHGGAGHHPSHGRHQMTHEAEHGSRPLAKAPTQPGQSAFAAIQEIVEILRADPDTDWSKVDIEALREHLIDMDNVTLRARVSSEPVDGGVRFVVSGEGGVADSIRRMILAHSAAMDGVDEWRFEARPTRDGAEMIVLTPTRDRDELRGLGLLGVLTRGMHHQQHHLMIARGGHPHAH